MTVLTMIGAPIGAAPAREPSPGDLATTTRPTPAEAVRGIPSRLQPAKQEAVTPEIQLASDLEQTLAIMEAVSTKVALGMDPSEELNLLAARKIELDVLEKELDARFDQIERHLAASGLKDEGAIAESYRKIFREQFAALRDGLESVRHARSSDERRATLNDSAALIRKLGAAGSPGDSRPHGTRRELRPAVRRDPIRIDTPQDREAVPGPGTLFLGSDLPGPGDLAATPDVQLTPAATALAASLGNSPVRLYEHVRNACAHQLYPGSLKGSEAALETQAGNDYDLASLLIALLRVSNIPARYVSGTVDIPTQDVMDWLRITDAAAANSILNTAGITAIPFVDGGNNIIFYRVDRVWVEAYVPTGNYRAAGTDQEGLAWVPLDPFFKTAAPRAGVPGLFAAEPFDESTYLSQRRRELTYEFYRQQISDFLLANEPGKGLSDVPYDGPVEEQRFGLLPFSLPFEVASVTSRFSQIPDAQRHKVRIRLIQGSALFDHTVTLPVMSLKRLTLAYPTTAFSQQLVHSFGGLTKTPLFMVNVTPQLLLDGVAVAQGPAIAFGSNVELQLDFTEPGPVAAGSVTHDGLSAGELVGIGLEAFQISEQHLNRQRNTILNATIEEQETGTADEDELLGAFMYLAIQQHHARVRAGEDVLAGLTQFINVRSVYEGIAKAENQIVSLFGVPFLFYPSGQVVDVPRQIIGQFSIDDDDTLQPQLFRLNGFNGSAQEHATWEELVAVDGMSTIKSLQRANEVGIPVFEIDSGNCPSLCPQLNLDPSTEANIQFYVNQGCTVTTPRDPTPLLDWNGVGYIVDCPDGSIAFLISGGLSSTQTTRGGAVVVVLEDGTVIVVSGGNTGQGEGVSTAGDPVNIANGNFVREELDFTIPALGFPLEFRRYYNSQLTMSGSLGIGWTHSYSDKMVSQGGGSVTWINHEGGLYTFAPNGMGGFVTPGGLHGVLTATGGGGHSFRRRDGVISEFDSAGRLILRKDRNNNTQTLGYDGSGRLTTVTDPASRQLTFAYNGDGRVATLSDFTGRTWTYTYTSGRLSRVESPSDVDTLAVVTQYEYYTSAFVNGRLKRITEPNGGIRTLAYYANGRVFQQTDPEGHLTTLVYNPFKSETTLIDPRGSEWIHGYNAAGNMIRLVQPDGSIESWVWTNNLVTSHTDELGSVETFEYDTNGNLTRELDQTGVETLMTYDPTFAQMLTLTRPGGRIVSIGYNAAGNPTSITDPEGGVASFTYGAPAPPGLPQTVTNARNLVRTFVYNSAGQPLTESTSFPSTTQAAYTSRGRVLQRTDENNHTTTHGYDLLDRLTSVTTAENDSTLFAYDSAGRLIRVTDGRGNATETHYDSNDRIVGKTFADKTSVVMEYDGNGNLVAQTDELGNSTRFVYDSRNRKIETHLPDQGITGTKYDAAGRLVAETDALGNSTQFEYDDASRLVKTIDAFGEQTARTYDENGSISSLTDRRGAVTTLEYDKLNRLTETRGEEGLVRTFDYDPNGNVTARTDYDVTGVDPIPDDPRTLPEAIKRTWSAEYDLLDRATSETDPLGGLTVYTLDARGNVTAVSDPRDKVTEFVHDAVNRVTTVTHPDDGESTITYDAAGNRASLTVPRGGTYAWTYDQRNRVLTATDPLTNATQYSYDAVGNLVQQDNPGGTWVRHTYDAMRRLVSTHRADATWITNIYDRAGNLVLGETEKTTLHLQYDALNRQTTERLVIKGTSFDKTVGYAYDDEGDLLTVTDPTGRILTHTHDLARRLTGITTSGGGPSVSIDHNGYGERAVLTFGNGVSGSFTYDKRGRVTLVDYTPAIAQIAFVRDPAGNPTAINESIGGVSESLAIVYDDLNRPTTVTAAINPSVRSESFVYDLDGNLTGPGNGDSVAFNLAAQPTTNGALSYGHDPLGNLVSSQLPGNQLLETPHDPSSRVSAFRQWTGAILNRDAQLTRDALSRIVEIAAGSTITRIVYAFQNRLLEYNGSGQVTASYVMGTGLDDAFAVTTTGGARYLHRDEVGSVRSITSAAGQVIGGRQYGLFGRLLAQTGVSDVALGYAGSPFDAPTGLVDLRARAYEFRLGRFLSRDPLRIHPRIPNPYVYAGNRPLLFVDPLGLKPQSGGWWTVLDVFQGILDLGGLVPGFGEPADGLNALIYLARGDDLNAGLSAAGMIPIAGWGATGVKVVKKGADAVDTGTDLARRLGREGEEASGLIKNTEHIPSQTPGRYRIPDGLNHELKLLSEVKNVSSQAYTQQLRDFAAYARQNGYTFELFVRPTTQLSGPLQQAVQNGEIVLKFLP